MQSVLLPSDPYAHYARMRASNPVYFNADRRVWEVYGYHDLQSVLADPETFSSDIHSAAAKTRLQTMLSMDPPRHTQFRKLISRAFTTKIVAALEPSIQDIIDDLIAAVAGAGEMDVMTDFAHPLPVTVISELLGLPLSDREQFKRWAVPAVQLAEVVLQGQVPAPPLLEAMAQMTQYLETLATERKRAPGDDLISGLTMANVDGETLTIQDITSTCRLLLIGGFETTTNLIGNTMHLLLKHPTSLAQVQAQPELLPSAIEESLRFHTPFHFFARIAMRDVQLGGHSIRAGEQVVVYYASGNRDPAAFTDPDRFDITRLPNRHLAFGHGIHYCLGAGLARLEGKVGISTLLQRFPDMRLSDQKPIQPLTSSSVMFGLDSLPVRFTPAP